MTSAFSLPTTCDICNRDVTTGLPKADRNQIIDGRTHHGHWAWMCRPCHKRIGVGFGLGRGQRFDITTGSKVEG